MVHYKDFQGESGEEVMDQFNSWAYDQYNYAADFAIVDLVFAEDGTSLKVGFEGEEYEEYVEPTEPALDTQYSEFPTRDRTTYELSQDSYSYGQPGLAEYALILALIAVLAIAAVVFLGDQINAILTGATPSP